MYMLFRSFVSMLRGKDTMYNKPRHFGIWDPCKNAAYIIPWAPPRALAPQNPPSLVGGAPAKRNYRTFAPFAKKSIGVGVMLCRCWRTSN